MCRSSVVRFSAGQLNVTFCRLPTWTRLGVCERVRARSNIKANEARILSFIRQAEQLMSMRREHTAKHIVID